MHKRGQVTIFFVVGVILITTIFIYTQFSEKDVAVHQPVPIESQADVHHFVEGCLEQVGEDAIYYIMLQGGYYYTPIESTPILDLDIAHYWDNGTNRIVSLETIEEELSYYIEDNMRYCLNNFSEFNLQGYDVDGGSLTGQGISEIDVVTLAFEDNVLFKLNAPILLQKGTVRSELTTFAAQVEIPLRTFYFDAVMISAAQEEVPLAIPISEIATIAQENGFTFEAIYHDDNTVIISLVYEIPHKDSLIYSFIHNYNWDDII